MKIFELQEEVEKIQPAGILWDIKNYHPDFGGTLVIKNREMVTLFATFFMTLPAALEELLEWLRNYKP